MPADPSAVAAHIRNARAEIVRAIRAGTVDLATVGRGPDIDQVKIVVLVEAVPGVGKVKARHLLDALGVEHGARWGELDAHRAAIIDGISRVSAGDASPASAP